MARDGPLNIQKQQQRAREKRKNKSSRQKARIEKLTRLNPKKLWSQKRDLETRANLDKAEEATLKRLQRDLRDIQKVTSWRPPPEDVMKPEESVFYHHLINPTGTPPPGFMQFRADEFESTTTDESTACIPLPEQQEDIKTVYESGPQLRISITSFKPRTI